MVLALQALSPSAALAQPRSSSTARLAQTQQLRAAGRRSMNIRAALAAPLGAAATVPVAGLAAAGVAAVAAAAMLRSKELRPQVKGQSTSWNSAVLSLCPSLTAPYRLPALLNNGHVVRPWGWACVAGRAV